MTTATFASGAPRPTPTPPGGTSAPGRHSRAARVAELVRVPAVTMLHRLTYRESAHRVTRNLFAARPVFTESASSH
jgi:hypothetical protein